MFAKKDYVIHTEEEIPRIRYAAQTTAYVRDQLKQLARAGMSTFELDQLAGKLIADTGGNSAFLGYRGFPGNVCISVNDEVVHGIGRPDRILDENDIVSIDIGVEIDGGIGDTAVTFPLKENIDKDTERLLKFTEKSLMTGITKAVKGNFIRDISAAVEKVAKKADLSVVREYVGHGCGIQLHEPPEVPNFVCSYRGPRLRPGMILAIEPMLNLGTYKVFTESDHWTVRTLDGRLSAHFEHMVLITDNEPEILTWAQ
ncbi:MAG: type I methionyl aminopeptidase [Lentisphaerae bacterium]|nr:type I methionyl aminopeptidase [Lentisphaerota bacterium]MCP4099931.1 type I methionyl aminopeptidase [Lentisphaerota bacterium]